MIWEGFFRPGMIHSLAVQNICICASYLILVSLIWYFDFLEFDWNYRYIYSFLNLLVAFSLFLFLWCIRKKWWVFLNHIYIEILASTYCLCICLLLWGTTFYSRRCCNCGTNLWDVLMLQISGVHLKIILFSVLRPLIILWQSHNYDDSVHVKPWFK